jgi:hypothetical protein
MILLTHEQATINAMNEAALASNVCDLGRSDTIKRADMAFMFRLQSPFAHAHVLTR